VFAVSQYHQTPTVTILATNPYLPAALRTQMQTLGLRSFNMGRVDTEWLGTSGDNTLKSTQLATGLKGSWADFKWDLGFNYGESKLDSRVYGTREANLAAAEYAITDTSGNIVCGPLATNPNFATARLTNTIQVANVQSGCVPLNPFGVGNSSQAARDYVAGIEYTNIDTKRTDVAFNVSGPLFQLPAGALSAAAGIEYRKDSLSQVADPLQIQGLYSSGNAKTYSGDSHVTEGYLEVEAPLLKDVAFARSLGLNGAVRRTKYNVSGSVTTWKAGATWQPLDSLRFRATKSRDIRAPSLSDLYLIGGISATGSFVNPFNGQSARLPVQTTGNQALVPERADTFSYGLTFQGQDGALSGLHFSADYYHIKVKDVIASVGATDILQRCFQGITSYCSAITFDTSAFGISKVFTQPFNQALLDTQGVDLELGKRMGLEALHMPGTLDMSLFATRLLHSKTTDRPGPAGVTIENAGVQAALPEWVGSVFVNYRLEPLTVGMQMKMFSSIRYSALFFGPDDARYNPALSNSINKNKFGGGAYFNLNGSYDFALGDRKVQLFANVNNLMDREPPMFAIAAINLGGNPYDYVGRTYKLGVRMDF
jgi:iron complex outermembrane recepter protein